MVELNVSSKKPQLSLYKLDTISVWQKCPLYGDVCFTESQSNSQKSSKVNLKSTICHDFPSLDLLERPKLTKTDPRRKIHSNWTLPHHYIDIQPTTRGCK